MFRFCFFLFYLYCLCSLGFLLFFFFKQNTGYGLRISDWSSDVCSSDLLLVNALRAHPDKVLLRTWEGGSFTGAEIETAVARYIAVLERHGVALGATVGLLAGNSVEVLFAQQAIGVIGGVFTPFHPLGAPADFAYILNDAGLDIVIVAEARHADMAKAIELSERSPLEIG